MYALAIVLLITLLSVYAYKFLQKKRSAVSRKYDVFLSFRGPDTRTGFTDFLYHSLVAAGIRVFRDDAALPTGELIKPELIRAIRACRISIPIISEQYAESKACLLELAEIMRCHKNHDNSVFPVFYNVYASDVRRQMGCFQKAFWKHKRECGDEKIKEWREALVCVANVMGWRSNKAPIGHEGELVKMVVAKVSSELSTTWIERLPTFIRSVYPHFWDKRIRDSEWQVYLSFHGPDTQNGIVGYLCVSLVAAGIAVFYDADPSHIGKDSASLFRNAINQCKTSIVVLSANYAASRWCLIELARIVECKSRMGQNIIPIFYKVSPSHVKGQSDRFGERLIEHKHRVEGSTYERWVRALKVVGSSSGYVSEEIANGHEGVLVKQVVQKVSSMLKNPQAHGPQSSSTEH